MSKELVRRILRQSLDFHIDALEGGVIGGDDERKELEKEIHIQQKALDWFDNNIYKK